MLKNDGASGRESWDPGEPLTAEPRDRVLGRLLGVRERARTDCTAWWLDDLEFLLGLALVDYDLSAEDLASNVRELVEVKLRKAPR